MDKVVTVVGCFIWHEGKFLIVHRIPEEQPGNCWGLPAGGVKVEENLITAIQRERVSKKPAIKFQLESYRKLMTDFSRLRQGKHIGL